VDAGIRRHSWIPARKIRRISTSIFLLTDQMSRLDFQTFKWPSVLYRGSSHLYHVHCYINNMRVPLSEYLNQIHHPQFANPVSSLSDVQLSEWQKRTRYALDNYSILMPNDFSPEYPWTYHVVFLFCMQTMSSLGIPTVRVSDFLAEQVAEFQQSKPLYTKLYGELISWAKDLDRCRDLRDVDHKKLLNLDFFNVMRQPIQFFSSETIATMYAKNGPHELYQYDLDQEIKVVNISEVSNIQSLMSSPEMPYWSTTVYSEEITKYFECNPDNITATSIIDILDAHYAPIKESMAAYDLETERLEQLWVGLKWHRYKTLGLSYYDEGTVDKILAGHDSWLGFLQFMVPDLYENQRELWLHLVQQYQITTGDNPNNHTWVTDQIVEHILIKFPGIDDENVDSFLELMDGLYYSNISKRREDRKVPIVQQLIPFFEALKTRFRVKVSNIEKFDAFMTKILSQSNHHAWVRTVGDLTEIWSEVFEIPILSPRGLWLTVQWPILQNLDQRGRLSWYNVDCLLVYTLTTSSWFKTAKVDGWVCLNPYEVMVYHPEKHGKIRRMMDTYVNTECQYEYLEM